MSSSTELTPSAPEAGRAVALAAVGAILLLLLVGALVTYKATGAMAAMAKARATGSLAPKLGWLAVQDFPNWLKPLAGTINYFSWVFVALAFGVLIGAATSAWIPDRWHARTLGGGGVRGPLMGALMGAPLMLCSCCVLPVFEGVYGRTRRLGPALALMLAAPALNPFAHALTFLLFPADIAVARLVASLFLVLGGSAGLALLIKDPAAADRCSMELSPPSVRGMMRALGRSLAKVASRSLPAVLVGVVASVTLSQAVPISSIGLSHGAATTFLTIAVALLVAFPTFGEIPIALALLAAGAPKAAALGVLIAGPAINLPSLLGLKRSVSPRAAVLVALAVFATCAIAGAVV
ncbi:MAG: permease [Deltaproteobacteria bacterium]|nr:permease [Deltaproteobacteria bacterium]